MATLAKLYNHLSASSTNHVLFKKNKLHIHGDEYIDTARLAPPTSTSTPPIHQHQYPWRRVHRHRPPSIAHQYIDTATTTSTPPVHHHQYRDLHLHGDRVAKDPKHPGTRSMGQGKGKRWPRSSQETHVPCLPGSVAAASPRRGVQPSRRAVDLLLRCAESPPNRLSLSLQTDGLRGERIPNLGSQKGDASVGSFDGLPVGLHISCEQCRAGSIPGIASRMGPGLEAV
jgi:hypothetical protein